LPTKEEWKKMYDGLNASGLLSSAGLYNPKDGNIHTFYWTSSDVYYDDFWLWSYTVYSYPDSYESIEWNGLSYNFCPVRELTRQ